MALRTPADFRTEIRNIQRLYSTPQILQKALDLLRKPDVNLDTMGALIRNDAALVADILRLSNSAVFSRGTACADLELALQRLGIDEVIRAIDLSLSKNLFGKGLSNYGLSGGQYWRASLLGALLMEQLAEIHGVDAPEAYTVGILHGLGRVLINEALGGMEPIVHWNRAVSLEKWEVDHVGFTHAEAGSLLLKQWSFPLAIVNPIENQLGAPSVAKAQTPTGMLRLVRLLLTLDPVAATTPQRATFPPDLLGWAGFASEAEVRELLEEAQQKVQKIALDLGMDQEVALEGL